MMTTCAGLKIVRIAPKQQFTGLRFDVWMSLAKAAPLQREFEKGQMHL